MKTIFILAVILAVLDVAFLYIMKVAGYVGDNFNSLLQSSLYIIGIIFAATLVIHLIIKAVK